MCSDQLPNYSSILEPGFYWRVQRDYGDIPTPHMAFFRRGDSTEDILAQIKELGSMDRLVLHGLYSELDEASGHEQRQLEESLAVWANDSIGVFPAPYGDLRKTYVSLPSVKAMRDSAEHVHRELAQDMLHSLRTCKNIFNPPPGNRSCFQICD
ncbi:hypothetical protein EON64_00925 [archaeon]|nr:MAG: hypothetical protein EON64_00925 [archaeon]